METRTLRNSGEIRFGALPMGRWTVRWIGDVDFHSRGRTYSQPSMTVVLEGADGQHVDAIVPIAQLFPLALGRIWEDKIRTSEIDPVLVDRTINFTTTTALECQAGIPLDGRYGGGFLLPFHGHRHHQAHTKSWCLRVDINQEQIIFPATELIRFYFGSSGGLLKKLFSSDFSLSQVVGKFEMRPGRRAYIELPGDIAAASASDVARLALDDAALNAATLISRSLVAAKAGGLDAKTYVKATFPFFGIAKLLVRGMPLQGQDGVRRFLVTEICSCARPFPFASLEYVATSRPYTKAAAQSAHGNSQPSSQLAQRKSSARVAGRVVENDEPKNAPSPSVVRWDSDARFPDLRRKPIRRVDHAVPTQVLLSMMPAKLFESTGHGTSTGRGQRIDPVIEVDETWRLGNLYCPVAGWQLYFEFLKRLGEQDWIDAISFVRLDPRQVHSHFALLPELVDAEGCIVENTLRFGTGESASKALRHRLASFVNLKSKGTTTCLLSLCPVQNTEEICLYLWPGQHLDASNALVAVAKVNEPTAPIEYQKILLSGGPWTSIYGRTIDAALQIARVACSGT